MSDPDRDDRCRDRVAALPLKVGNADTDGLNDAYDAVVHGGAEMIREAGYLLREEPKMVIRRVLRLNAYQRAALAEMSSDETGTLVGPVIDALGSREPCRVRLRLTESLTTQSPLKIHCHIDIET